MSNTKWRDRDTNWNLKVVGSLWGVSEAGTMEQRMTKKHYFSDHKLFYKCTNTVTKLHVES